MKRTIAFLDILGFKQMIKETPLPELAQKYERVIDATAALSRPLLPGRGLLTLFPDHSNREPWCHRYVFSDSIILISTGRDEISSAKLIVYSWRITQVLLAYGMPVRGSVVHGNIYEEPRKNIVLGAALTEAYECEQEQQWAGVSIVTSAEMAFPRMFTAISKGKHPLEHIVLRYPVPFKDGTSKDLYTLNWRFNLFAEKGTRSLFSPNGEEDVHSKIQNTLEYARTIVTTGRAYAPEGVSLPVELRAFSIGAKEPPFPHGDDL